MNRVRKKNKIFVDSADRTPHYSLRKLSVGVASVLLSTTLWMGANGSVAHADTINDTTVAREASNSAKNKSVLSETPTQNGQGQTTESTDSANADAQADVEPVDQTQQTDLQDQVPASASEEEQASTADQASAAATEGKTNGSANAGAAIGADPEANRSDAAMEGAKNESTTPDVSQAFKTSKKMVARAAKLADRYDAKGATKTVIYGQAIDPNSLITNFSSLPTGTKASASNLDSIKTKHGRNVVPVTVTYSDGSTDAADAIVWVTPEGTTALAKSVSLQSNAATDKPEVTVGINTDVSLPFKYTGTAVVNGSDIAKDAKIYFSTLAEKYNETIGYSPASEINVVDSDNDIIGNLYIYSSQYIRSFMLNVTTAKKYDGDVNIRFDAKNEGQMYSVWQPSNNLRSIYLVDTDDPYDYSGTVVQKRWLHAVGQDDKEYTINRTVSPVEVGTTRGPNVSGMSPSVTWQHITIHPQLVGYQGSTANPKNTTITSAEAWKIADEIWKGKGKVKPADLPEEANWHEIFQVTTNVSELPDNFNIGNWNLDGDVQAATADGQPSNQNFRLGVRGNLFNAKVVRVADNLSIQQLYDETSSGQVGYSKQANGQFLICFNLSANDTAPKDKTAYANTIIRNMDRNGNIALSKDYDKITKATADFYANNVVPNFAAWWQDFSLSVNNAFTSDRKWIIADVTPGHPAYSVTRTYTAGTASAGGESRLTNTAYFVDDNHNQAIVGGQHQISGKKGDTVPLNLTVPSGYILASGQALPTSYTFTGSDSDIVIHLVPIYKSAGQTSDVHRTIYYKTTDGSPAPETKIDDLKFYGTTITGDLSNLTNRAEQDGLTVTKDADKTYATKEEALDDLDKQAADIQSKVTKYEAEKAAYDAAMKVYNEDLKKWNDAQSSNNPHMIKGISQGLSFANEHDASLDVTSENDKPVNFIKSSAWLGSDGMGVYTDGMYSGGNISKSFSESDISYSQAEGTGTDSKNWGKTYTGIQLGVGESVVARYTGLKNSVYIDKANVAHKLSKVQVKYTLNETTASDGTANIFLSNNPNIALWYGTAGNRNGRVDLTIDLTFYDENGKPITLGKDSNAWLDMSSLNNGTTKVEYFAPNGNTTMQIPGSSIESHADGWYAKDNNEIKHAGWDNPTSADRYWGAAIMELEGNSFHIGQKITKYNPNLTNSRNVYSWFALDSSLATAYKPVEPKAPDKPKIAWHEVTNTTWDGPKDFADVTSPEIKGYKPSQPVVSNKNISHDHADITETVIYTAETQKAHVKYVDDTTGKTLKTDDLTGASNSTASKDGKTYTTADSINGYIGQGYKLFSDSTNGSTITFDAITGVDQYHEVHLVHDTYTKDVSDDVHRTIIYVVKGGNHSALSPVGDNLHFTGVQTYDKLNNNLLKTDWEPNKDFADVTSPEIKGYKPSQPVVSNKNISHDHVDITETVTYTAEIQKAHVKYVDDTTGKTLKTDDLTGESDTTASKDGKTYTTDDSINGYIGQGYKLFSDSTNGSTITFDATTGVNQYYEVHLVHDTYTKDVSDDVHRTIIYVVKGGNHSAPSPVGDNLHFTGVQTYDKLNNNLLKTDWEPNKDFADVTSPEIKGYKPSQPVVSNKNIGHDHADITETVTYTAEIQKAQVEYIDDTIGKTLKTDDLIGESDTTASKDGKTYTTGDSIKTYVGQGYKLVSDGTKGATILFDDNTGETQIYEVRFVHDTYTKDVSDDVHRTVHYVVKGGNHAAPEDAEADLLFRGKQTWDSVTKTLLTTDWEPNKDFVDVGTPEIQGYTADKTVISNRNIAHDADDIKEVVTYTANKQAAHVKYVDDTDGKDIKTDNLTGDSDTLASLGGKPYTTEASINYYLERGYSKVSDDTNGMTIMLDHVTGQDQYYTVHFVHSYVTITSKTPGKPGQPINPNGDSTPVWPSNTGVKDLQHDVNRTINYVVAGGMVKAPDSVKDSLHFEETRVYDKVNGKLISDEWSPNQDFKDVESPAVVGYTPDKPVVSNKNVAHDAKDIDVVVTYNADAQNATVAYVDDKTGKTLKTDGLTGVTNAKSGYTTADSIKTYQALGYKLVSDDTKGAEVVFDNEDGKDQSYIVHFNHDTITVDPENPGKPGEPINPGKGSPVYPDGTDKAGLTDTVARTISYKMSDGSKAPASVKDSLTFTASKEIDKATGEVLSTKWSKNQDFKDVESPAVVGYTPDKPVVSNKNVAHDAKDIDVVVTYNADAQKATVAYVDDKTGKTLKTDGLTGVTNAKSGYTTADSIKTYQALGYKLVSDDTKGAEVVFDNEDGKDQSYTVHFNHDTITVDPENPGKPGEPINPGKGSPVYPDGTDKAGLTDTVARTISYKMSDGSKAPASVKDSLIFTASKEIDKATGEVLSTKWSKNQDFKDVESPAVAGYTPDKPVVSNKNVAHDAKDIDVVVTYEADAQKATVAYVDDKTGQTIETKTLTGVSNAHSGYSTISTIKDLENKGYKLAVDGDETKGDEIVFDNDSNVDQSYEVHLKHGTVTVTPDDKNPVKPGDKINPNDPNSPKYQEDVKHDNLAKDAKQTVHYEGAGTDTPADSVTTQKDVFTRTVTYDKVTGKSTTSGWSKSKTTFDKVDTPVVKGYTADKKQAGGLTATPGHPEVKDTVVYTPNGSIVPVDPNGNLIPNAPSVPYETNPNDPTKVVDGKVPEVPSWTPKNGNPGDPVTPPKDPTKDTKVPYDHTKTPGETTVSGKQTVTYVYKDKDGKVVKTKTVEEGTTFTGKTTKDEVTGKTTTTWDQKDHTYTAVTTPVEPGYTADKKSVGGETVTPADPNRSYEVVYTPNGSIVPVDPNGNPIPNTPSVPYETNPKDPTKVVDSKVPEVPSWTPKNGKPGDPVVPTVPTKDTEVSYDHTMTPGETTVSGKQTVTYVYKDKNGKVVKTKTVEQDATFTGKTTKDEVTGKTTTTWDQKDHKYTAVTTPVVKGYTADKKSVGGETVTPADPNRSYEVVYTPNGSIVPVDPNGNPIPNTPSVPYETDPNDPTKVVDGKVPEVPSWTPKNGKPGEPVVPKVPSEDTEVSYDHTMTPGETTVSGKQTVTYVYKDKSGKVVKTKTVEEGTTFTGKTTKDEVTGKTTTTWDQKDHKYTAVTTPVVKGYTADKKSVGGDTVTPDNPNRSYEVVYTPNGSIVPVDPNGNPIPNTPSVPYETDPKDPTKAVDGKVPEVPSWTPKKGKPGDPVVPKVPSEDTKVSYDHTKTTVDPKVEGKQTVTYVYKDKNGKVVKTKTVEQDTTFTGKTTKDEVTGKTTTTWDQKDHTYTAVTTPVEPGYTADKKSVGGETVTPADPNRSYEVVYTPNGSIVPVDPNGNPIPNTPSVPYETDPKDPTKVVDGKVPEVPSWTPKNGKPGDPVTPKDPTKDTEVLYDHTMTPSETAPTGKVERLPEKLVKTPAKAPKVVKTAEPAKTNSIKEAAQAQDQLPQTGEDNSKAVFGLGLASILGGIGILGAFKRKKKEN